MKPHLAPSPTTTHGPIPAALQCAQQGISGTDRFPSPTPAPPETRSPLGERRAGRSGMWGLPLHTSVTCRSRARPPAPSSRHAWVGNGDTHSETAVLINTHLGYRPLLSTSALWFGEKTGFLDQGTVKSCLSQGTKDKTVRLALLRIASGLVLDRAHQCEPMHARANPAACAPAMPHAICLARQVAAPKLVGVTGTKLPHTTVLPKRLLLMPGCSLAGNTTVPGVRS